MNEKRKCVKCNLLIDSDLDTCPYCGYPQNKEEDNKNREKIEIVESQKPTRNFNLFDFEQKDIRINVIKQIFLFITGWLGMTAISLLFQYISQTVSEPLFTNTRGIGLLNFIIYFILFGILSLICCTDIINLLPTFKKGKEFLTDLGYGGMLVCVSLIVNIFFNLIGKMFHLNVEENANESGIDSIVSIFPILSLIIFGIIVILIIATESMVSKLFNKWIKFKYDELELKKYDIDTHLNVTDNIETRLDTVIESCFQEYSLMNLIYKTNWYIKEEEEIQISKDICSLVSDRISPVMLKQLELYYNQDAIYDVIAKRVYFKVTNFVIEHNKTAL